ncbi:MAG: NADPH:quinone oxidoreductase [Cryobacterium sp.]|jgi:NADPH2:quinone reductase|nr:NADPH:quinone oxidoreductase [Cryobacterium sp.]
MRAVRVVNHEGPRSLVVAGDVEIPEPADGLLVEVHAAGVTYPDVLQTRGSYQLRHELPFTLGSVFAGRVKSAPASSRFAKGDRVAGIVQTGAFAEYCAANEHQVVPLPDQVPFASGAGMPMNVLTADFALGHRGNLRRDETVLIHGAAGGLGVALIQRARLAGARIIAVVSTAAKAEIALSAGADETIAPSGFLDTVRAMTGGRGVDMVVDPVGGERFTDSLRALAPDGRLVVLGFTGGSIPTVKVNRLLLNNIAVIGAGWGGLAGTATVSVPEQWNRLLPAIEAGYFDPIISRVLPLQEAAEAVASLDERRSTGKVILEVRADESP